MPNKQQAATSFTIEKSNWLILINTSLHCLSIMAAWLNDLPTPYKWGITLLICASWFYHYKASAADNKYLRYTPSNGWAICLKPHDFFTITITPTTVTGKMLTILHYKTDNHSQSLVIFKHAMTANAYRRLTVLLKISG